MQAGGNGKSVKCIYVAPTKVRGASAWSATAGGAMVLTSRPRLQALCSEKYREWTMKFATLGVNCERKSPAPIHLFIFVHRPESGCEMTGDTVQYGKAAWGSARDATIM